MLAGAGKLEPVICAKAGFSTAEWLVIQRLCCRLVMNIGEDQDFLDESPWIPAFAGMTIVEVRAKACRPSKESPCAS